MAQKHKQRPTAAGRAELRRRPAHGRLLLAARRLLAQRGYEALSVAELAAAAGVSRETFYAHFADKRECVAAACDPQLERIDSELRRGGELDREWAGRLAEALEETLADVHAPPDAPRGRLLCSVLDLAGERGFPALRLAEVLEAAQVSRSEFYRHFESLRHCFACAGARLIARLETDVHAAVAKRREHAGRGARADGGAATPHSTRPPLPDERPLALAALGERLAADPQAARILVLEASHLEPERPPSAELADARSLAEPVSRLLGVSEEPPARDPTGRFAVGAVVEAIRSAVIAGELDQLPTRLPRLAEIVLGPDRAAATPDEEHRRGGPARRRHPGSSASARRRKPATSPALR